MIVVLSFFACAVVEPTVAAYDRRGAFTETYYEGTGGALSAGTASVHSAMNRARPSPSLVHVWLSGSGAAKNGTGTIT